MFKRQILTFILLCCLAPAAFSDILVASWNIKHLGYQNDKDINKVAHVIQHFDFVAIQELMNGEALVNLEAVLENATGEGWSSMASHALGRSTYREHAAFIWRDSAVEYDSGAVVFIDNRDVFAREPFSAKFRSQRSGQTFAAGTVHITYGDNIGDRLPEVAALADYWEWMEEVYPDTPRLLLGDFNLAPSHQGWEPLRQLGVNPVVNSGATTLGTKEGVWSNLYDNIWMVEGRLDVTDHGILMFPRLFQADHLTSRKIISDHAPVWLSLGDAELVPSTFAGAALVRTPDTNCIDLNQAPIDQLTSLPNIGPARANDIVDLRPWESAGALERINGLGPARVGAIIESGLLCSF